ncbi:MAG: bifunctional deaminase-reductase domain protein [Acidimicrobiales bacterium]|nr:bifunctional deaminase-reductase domain protein [Acidimicrobiales bacterium]
MRQLFPEVIDPVDLSDVYDDLPTAEGRPAVRLNMISSVDGATALEGLSGGLGSLADKRVFAVLRSLADVVLVAAGTVRAEGYGPASLPIAVVTRSAQLDWQSAFFTEADAKPIVVTVADAPEENLAHASEVADLVLAGTGSVDFRLALDALALRGARSVLAEGGPTLNGHLALAGVLDEVCLTFSPKLAAGDAKRILDGPPLPAPTELRLRSVCEEDDYLFLRYRR